MTAGYRSLAVAALLSRHPGRPLEHADKSLGELAAKVHEFVRTIEADRQSALMRVKEIPVTVIPRRPS